MPHPARKTATRTTRAIRGITAPRRRHRQNGSRSGGIVREPQARLVVQPWQSAVAASRCCSSPAGSSLRAAPRRRLRRPRRRRRPRHHPRARRRRPAVWRRASRPLRRPDRLGPGDPDRGEFLAGRKNGTIHGGPISLQGYWSFRAIGSLVRRAGESHRRARGVLQRRRVRDHRAERADRDLGGPPRLPGVGPALTPFVPEALMPRLLDFGNGAPGGYKNGLWALPVPIVVRRPCG